MVNILSGIIKPDSGEIFVDNKPTSFNSPLDAKKAGIATIHQRLSMTSHITAAEFLYLNTSLAGLSGLCCSFKKMNEQCHHIFDLLKIDFDPHALISSLTVGQKQILQFAVACALNPRFIILDELFSVLTPVERVKFGEIFLELKNRKISILMVTHNIAEALTYCDEITILKDGRLSAHLDNMETRSDDMIQAMTQNEPVYCYPHIPKHSTRIMLSARNISSNGILRNISFDLYKGEILGVAGLLGSGRSSLAKALFGINHIVSGELIFNGEKIKIKSPSDAMKLGIALLPEDIILAGVIQSFSVSENISLSNLPEITHSLFLDTAKQNKIARQYIKQFVIKTKSENEHTRNLSTGNQQKVNISKWQFHNSSILIMDDPTQSVDVTSKVEIYNFMNKFVMEGGSIIFISSDFEELCGMSDRMLIMKSGRVIKALSRAEFSGLSLIKILSES